MTTFPQGSHYIIFFYYNYGKNLIQFCQHLDKIRYHNNIYNFDRHAFFKFYLQLLLLLNSSDVTVLIIINSFLKYECVILSLLLNNLLLITLLL